MNKLSFLRVLFVIYIIVKTVIEMVIGGYFGNDLVKYMHSLGVFHFPANPYAYFILIFFIDLIVILGIGLLIFRYLREKKNWARILLLVIAWLTVVNVVTGLLFAPQIAGMLERITPGMDWKQLFRLDRITDLLALIYSAYLIYVLQFDNSIKQLFSLGPGDNATDPK